MKTYIHIDTKDVDNWNVLIVLNMSTVHMDQADDIMMIRAANTDFPFTAHNTDPGWEISLTSLREDPSALEDARARGLSYTLYSNLLEAMKTPATHIRFDLDANECVGYLKGKWDK